MSEPLFVGASSWVSCLGEGWPAHGRALATAASGLAPGDFSPAASLATWVGRVAAADDAPLPATFADYDCRNNRLAWRALGHDGLDAAVRRTVARVGAARVGVFVGTSTSGILDTELVARNAALRGASPAFESHRYAGCHSLFATTRFLMAWFGLTGPAMTVSTACSSSAKVFVAARRAIRAGRCDAAIVAGVDSLALSTLYGFHALQLLSASPCRPCAADRSGISIGEAAAIALVGREASDVALTGAGESSDAHHMSTPPADGHGARRAMTAALADAGLAPSAIDYINLHGTGTPANDAAEAAAIRAVFGSPPLASSTKGATGHALGAAGALEALVSIHALRNGCVPANVGTQTPDPRLGLAIACAPTPARLSHVLSNSFGFGGSNCALVFTGS